MKLLYLVLISIPKINGGYDEDKEDFCMSLECDNSVDEPVCGVKYEEDEVTYKPFNNECQLLEYGCLVEDRETYGIINMEYCQDTSTEEPIERVKFILPCPDCSTIKSEPVCGIRQDGDGFRIRKFQNECQLRKHNCEKDLHFSVTDYSICTNVVKLDDNKNNVIDDIEPTNLKQSEEVKHEVVKMKNLVLVDGSMFNMQNINESVDNFFAATHVLDLPMKDMQPVFNETTRRLMLRIFGPIKVFRPWVKIPTNITDNYYHRPTLSSCYHKCPTKCPETYAPVCGVPGIVAREPSLMFQNHCFMDVAQCKMYWEGKSHTAESSAYIESSFLFCLGDELNGLYRFLPLVKTLQHMGRLKSKGHFRYKLQNMRFFNNLLDRQPRIMG